MSVGNGGCEGGMESLILLVDVVEELKGGTGGSGLRFVLFSFWTFGGSEGLSALGRAVGACVVGSSGEYRGGGILGIGKS